MQSQEEVGRCCEQALCELTAFVLKNMGESLCEDVI